MRFRVNQNSINIAEFAHAGHAHSFAKAISHDSAARVVDTRYGALIGRWENGTANSRFAHLDTITKSFRDGE